MGHKKGQGPGIKEKIDFLEIAVNDFVALEGKLPRKIKVSPLVWGNCYFRAMVESPKEDFQGLWYDGKVPIYMDEWLDGWMVTAII